MRLLIPWLFLIILTACKADTPAYSPPRDVDIRIENLMAEYDAATVGVGIIRDGKLVWTGYYGEQASGQAAGAQSVFNTASVSKTITTETALRLASKGMIDLDEPTSAYYVHPDLIDDPRHKLLTPRILLTHQAGFQNWPYMYEDGKLAFIDEPGNGAYNYAGIGFRILAKFLEAKLEKSYPQIVQAEIFDPIGMTHSAISHDAARQMDNVVMPLAENGKFQPDHGFKTNYWSAADDFYVTVEDYAAFLISVMKNEGVDSSLRAARSKVQTHLSKNPIWECGSDGVDPCPSPYGHGLGWFIFGYESDLVLHHGGNDQSEGAIGYFEPATQSGGIVFVNSPRGVQLWPEIVDVVDPDQKMQDVFHDLIRKFFHEP